MLQEGDGRRATTGAAQAQQLRLRLRMAWYAPLLLLSIARIRATVDADVAGAGSGWCTRRWPSRGRAWRCSRPTRSSARCYFYRLRRAGVVSAALASIAAVIYPGERTLHLACSDIGPGLFIQHGFATVVAARRVGRNCWINQQVTIGFTRAEDRPTIGDDVFVYAGAKVLGDITVGNGARVGANAVVLTDVPERYTAVGVPAAAAPAEGRPRHPRGLTGFRHMRILFVSGTVIGGSAHSSASSPNG